MVVAGHKQQHGYRHHCASPGKPDSLIERFVGHRTENSPQDRHDTQQEKNKHHRHLDEVVQVLVGFHIYLLRIRINSIAVGNQRPDEKSQEEYHKRHTVVQRVFSRSLV